MKKITFIIVLLCGILFFYQCKSGKGSVDSTPYVPSDAELATAQSRWPEASKESLLAGHDIYNTRCNTCHALPEIHGHTEIHWNNSVTRMAPKAKLTAEEKETLRRYILTILMTN